MNKNAYFQGGGGVNEPTPKKKKYKSDPAIVVQPRFKNHSFYKNFDYTETEGVDGPAKLGPGTGFYQNMDKYKSISDFRKKKKKLKYEAEDSYIQDDGTITKNRIKRRKALLSILTKVAVDNNNLEEDFIDNQINSGPILGGNGTVADSNLTGGFTDVYLNPSDLEGKTPDKLDYGRDYEIDKEPAEKCSGDCNKLKGLIKELEKLLNKYVNAAEPSLYGMQDGIIPKEDLDNFENKNPYYGETDSGNSCYNSNSCP